MWRLFVINCAMCHAWKLHKMCFALLCSQQKRRWVDLVWAATGTRMKHSRQIKGVSWGWSVEEVPPRVCCCNQCPALKSQWQCMRSHRNPIQGIYGTGTLTHMAIHAESNIRGGLRVQYICACTLPIATHQWAANKRMCAHTCTCSEIFESAVLLYLSATVQFCKNTIKQGTTNGPMLSAFELREKLQFFSSAKSL